MSKFSELDSDRQQIKRLTDVIPPPSFAETGRAGAVHFQSIQRAILYGRKAGHDEVSVRVTALCGSLDRTNNLTSSWPDVTCDACMKLLAAVKRENA